MMRVIEMLSERKRAILKAIVSDYIQRAEPVGSRTLARRYNLGISPATIRNEMADLDEMGYLEQPHTSAGRIPSYKGYRYYVDSLMEAEKLSPADEERLSRILQQRLSKIDAVFNEATRVLSEVSQYVSLIMTPIFGQQVFQQLRLVPLDSQFVVVLMVTDTGLVQNRVMEIPSGISAAELDQIADVFTKHLKGMPLENLNSTFLQELYSVFSRRNKALQVFLADLIAGFPYGEGEKVYLGGTTNILRQPEFHDVEKVRSLLQVLEEKDHLCRLLLDMASEDIAIKIGEENRCLQMKDCSIVAASYEINGRRMGTIGVLGPTRMDYARVVSVVEYMQKLLSKTLGEFLF
ncbi:MAG TPA: heat-inducible transcription repressor HrcA [Firmicutes bacterium]|nr:heat-inducible transcription repressor HrcA [Bacillota bacterium]